LEKLPVPEMDGELIGRALQYSCKVQVNAKIAWTMRLYTGTILSVLPHELVPSPASANAARNSKGKRKGKGKKEGSSRAG
jgi:hypothetical protein